MLSPNSIISSIFFYWRFSVRCLKTSRKNTLINWMYLAVVPNETSANKLELHRPKLKESDLESLV